MISNVNISNDYIHAVNSAMFKFIWRKKKDKIKRKVMISDYAKGGIRAPSIDVMAKSLNLAWISRLLHEGQTYKESWKVIPRCNYDKKFLARINLPQFYKSILQNFLELKISYKDSLYEEFVLFNNKDILLDGSTIFYRNWLKKGVYLIQDLLNLDGNFLLHPEFIEKYQVKCNFLAYWQVISAIPRHLLEMARATAIDKINFMSEQMFPLSSETYLYQLT